MSMDHNQAHILIVDDDERIRNLLQKFLLRPVPPLEGYLSQIQQQ